MKKLLNLLAVFSLITTISFADSSKISLGFMPYLSSDVLLQKYKPLARYLSKKIGKEVEIVIAKDYKTHIKDTGEDRLDISFLGGSPYVVITEKYGKKPLLVRYEFDHKPFFRSVIFTDKSSNLQSIKELKNKKFAFGNANSTLSTQVPLYMLLENQLSLDTLEKFEHLRNHENVILGVTFGDFDAGSVAEEVYKENKDKGIKALAYSPDVSTHLFVTRSNLDINIRERIQEALLTLNEEKYGDVLKSISKNLTGFSSVKDSDYNYHRDMLSKVIPELGKQ